MQNSRKLFCILLALLLCVMLPFAAAADEAVQVESYTCYHSNSLHPEVEPAPVDWQSLAVSLGDDEYYDNVADAAEVVREEMEKRNPVIAVNLEMKLDALNQTVAKVLLEELLAEAFAHTGVPTQGDYLHWHYHSCGMNISGSKRNGTYYLTLTLSVTYYTDAQQEEKLGAAIDALLKELITDKMTDYEKLTAVYDWVCDNVVYDYENLEDHDYTLKYSAYAAMINGTSVCQGYSNLLYRMALQMGIDSRLISGLGYDASGEGKAHGWNIFKLGDVYYNADATWDTNYCEKDDYHYYLTCDEGFEDHGRDATYATEEFYAAYPMADKNYAPDEDQGISGYMQLTQDETVDISLSGDLYVDLNGHNMDGVIHTNGYTVYGMDTTTRDYSCDNMGCFHCVSGSGKEIVPQKYWRTDVLGTTDRYLTVKTQQGYTFQRFFIGVSHVSLKPTVDGFGYKAVFAGSDMVKAELNAQQSFGYTLQLQGNTPVTKYTSADQLVSGETVTLRLENFNVEAYSDTKLIAYVELKLADGTRIKSTACVTTLKAAVRELDAIACNTQALPASALELMRDMIRRHKVMQSWDLNALWSN